MHLEQKFTCKYSMTKIFLQNIEKQQRLNNFYYKKITKTKKKRKKKTEIKTQCICKLRVLYVLLLVLLGLLLGLLPSLLLGLLMSRLSIEKLWNLFFMITLFFFCIILQ